MHFEVLPLEQLHHHVDGAFGIRAEPMNPHDTRAPQGGERLRFAPEAKGILRIILDLRAQELDGNLIAIRGVRCSLDNPVTTTS